MKKTKLTAPKPIKAKAVQVIGPMMKYDAVTGSNTNKGSGNKRRQATIETAEEAGAAGILSNLDRLQAINLTRDMERNYATAKSMIRQLRNNVVGAELKVQFNTGDEFAKQANKWINKRWFNNCDFRSTEDFSKITRNIVAAKKREGDVLVMFDDGTQLNVAEGGTGKIICYEADQLAELDRGEGLPEGATQEAGVVRDGYGREIGYVVSKRRGSMTVSRENATIFRRDPDNEDANAVKLIKCTYRANQGRGTSEMLTVVAGMLDCYEMLSKELQTAKVAASLAGTVSRKEAVEDFDDERLDPTNENPESGPDAEATLPEDEEAPVQYERMEALTGGMFDYLAEGDEMTLHDIKRPNVHMQEFVDHIVDSSGAALGFAHAYARMKADTSYTAFRGDMILSWVSIYVEQKDIEREWLDWITVRAIRWAIAKGFITAAAPDGWEDAFSWHMPTMPYVDELKERQANAQALKNGEKDFSDLLGPDWKNRMIGYAEQLEVARQLGLPLSVFEQKSGGMAETEKKEGDKDEQD